MNKSKPLHFILYSIDSLMHYMSTISKINFQLYISLTIALRHYSIRINFIFAFLLKILFNDLLMAEPLIANFEAEQNYGQVEIRALLIKYSAFK